MESSLMDPTQVQLQHLVELSRGRQYKQVLDIAENMLCEFPKSPMLYNMMGVAFKGLGKLTEALTAFNQAITIKPEYADAHFNKGVIFQIQKQPDEAIDSYEQTLSINPDFSDAYFNLGIIYLEIQNFEDAKIYFEKALVMNPSHNKLGLSLALQGLGRYEQAVDAVVKKVNEPIRFQAK